MNKNSDYVPFVLEKYVSNPVALARIKATVTQDELADAMGVSLAHVREMEARKKVAAVEFKAVLSSLKKLKKHIE